MIRAATSRLAAGLGLAARMVGLAAGGQWRRALALRQRRADARLLSQSYLFDRYDYLRRCPQAAAGVDAIVHYLEVGADRGLAPGPRFDPAYYLASAPEAARSGLTPLVHYLRHGARAGHLPTPAPANPPAPLAAAAWDGLPQPAAGGPEALVLLDPATDPAATAQGLQALLAAGGLAGVRLVGTLDAATRAAIAPALALGRLTSAPADLGATLAALRGPLVVVRAGVVPAPGWLDRLQAALDRGADLAAPLSNGLPALAYPAGGPGPAWLPESGAAGLDALAAVANAGLSTPLDAPDVPALLVRADRGADLAGATTLPALLARARAAGLRAVVAGDVWVHDAGRPQATAPRLPAADGLHHALDLARLAAAAQAPGLLLVAHSWGGGTEIAVQRSLEANRTTGGVVLLLRPVPGDPGAAELIAPGFAPLPTCRFFRLDAPDAALAATLAAARIGEIKVHHLGGYGQEAPTWLAELAARAGLAYKVVLHDYLAFCPRSNLLDARTRFCGVAAPAGCATCLAAGGSPYGAPDVAAWRQRQRAFLHGALTVITPDADVATRFAHHWPEIPVGVRLHEPPAPFVPAPVRRRAPGEPLKVAVLGGLHVHKGLHVLEACAADAARRALPLAFVLIGYAPDERRLRAAGNVTITGAFGAASLPELLAAEACDLVFLPSIFPETYCQVLTVAFTAGLPSVVFDLGAQGRRVHALAAGMVLPLEAIADPQRINDALLRVR